jgi:PLD-like domain
MPVQLLYHDPDCPGAASPFDAALIQIAGTGNVRLGCPYIGLGYLRRVLRQSPSWWLLTDIEAWLRSQVHTQRERVYDFLVHNRDRVRHSPRLHAKIAIGLHSAMLGSANFTKAGIRQRTEVSVLFQNEPQVQELTDWFDAHWRRAYELDERLLNGIVAFMANLPEWQADETTPNPEISPPLFTQLASLVRLPGVTHRRRSGSRNGDFYFNYGHVEGWREWEDARKYGFICAGGGSWFSAPLGKLNPGDRVWVYAPHYGYVGVARVTDLVQPASSFQVRTSTGRMRPIMDVVASPDGYHSDDIDNPERCEYFVPVRWLQTVSVEQAVTGPGLFATELIVCRPTAQRWRNTLRRLRRAFPHYNQ